MSNEYDLDLLLQWLLAERRVDTRLPDRLDDKRRLLRVLMNERPPEPVPPEILKLQDNELIRQRNEKGIISPSEILEIPGYPGIKLWQGDITQLATEAIVNAANSYLLGCFSPLHNCIDNKIHSAAGMQMRAECASLMQGGQEAVGHAKITSGYNLPARWVIHTVGPAISNDHVTDLHMRQLESSYTSCLELASSQNIASIAFCCISTGVFNFPRDLAARIATRTVINYITNYCPSLLVVFNVFTDMDLHLYRKLLYNE